MMPKILLVDDEEDFHSIVRQVLEPLGYEIASAMDGEAGLERMRGDPPDLVLLDVNMPFKDGFAVCREIRATPQLAALPVILLTIRRLDHEVVMGLDTGADDYLTKPCEPAVLATRIERLLERS
ncbi:MAG: response regulator [Elusimicrobia bacterium]|nr:response regulator [Elusimicrobiota bacterium]